MTFIPVEELAETPSRYQTDDAERQLRDEYDGIRVHTQPIKRMGETALRYSVDVSWHDVDHGANIDVKHGKFGDVVVSISTGSIAAVVESMTDSESDDTDSTLLIQPFEDLNDN